MNLAAIAQRYVPVDEWLERPGVRIARALKHFDAATTEELWLAMELPTECGSVINTYAKGLERLVDSGHVQREGSGRATRYRLVKELVAPTLAAALAADGHLGEGYEGEERDDHFFWRGTWRKS